MRVVTRQAAGLDTGGWTKATRRDVGIWGAAFLALNGMIGAAIFGLPGKLDAAVGSFAPWLLLIAGFPVLAIRRLDAMRLRG